MHHIISSLVPRPIEWNDDYRLQNNFMHYGKMVQLFGDCVPQFWCTNQYERTPKSTSHGAWIVLTCFLKFANTGRGNSLCNAVYIFNFLLHHGTSSILVLCHSVRYWCNSMSHLLSWFSIQILLCYYTRSITEMLDNFTRPLVCGTIL